MPPAVFVTSIIKYYDKNDNQTERKKQKTRRMRAAGRALAVQSAQKGIFVEEVRAAGAVCAYFRPFRGRGGYLRSMRTHWPVSASWNIIQYPRPSGSNTERGINEQNPRSASGGAVRAAAGTP